MLEGGRVGKVETTYLGLSLYFHRSKFTLRLGNKRQLDEDVLKLNRKRGQTRRGAGGGGGGGQVVEFLIELTLVKRL